MAAADSTCSRIEATSTPRCSGAYGPSRRAAFSSCRSQLTRLARPAWYQATATWTSPWKKSRSSAGAARHASSSSSWAAKNSPRRIRSSPRSSSDGDADLAVFDANLVGLELDGAVELVLAGADVVLPAVPGTAQHVSLEPALAERSLQVEAVALRRVELVADPRERDVLLADPHARQRP